MVQAPDKQTRVRHWLLAQLESGAFPPDKCLPGARRIAAGLGISLLTVQNAIDTLCNEGVFYTEARRGTFVSRYWRHRALECNFRSNNPTLSWLPALADVFAQKLPMLRVASAFDQGVFELRPTLYVQAAQRDFLDLSELYERCFPDKEDFYEEAFRGLSEGGAMRGIPMIISPRVMLFNRRLLEQCDCPEPRADWTWADFMGTIRQLRRHLPGEQVFNFNAHGHQWLAMVFRSGGCVIDPQDPDNPVQLDSPATRRGLKLYVELFQALAMRPTLSLQYADRFAEGKLALAVSPRQDMARLQQADDVDWGVVPLPAIPGGADVTTQGTDILCIRRTCTDLKLAEQFLRLMLSDEVLDIIGRMRYGIPIRKSVAGRFLNPDDPRDAVFLREIPKMSAQYNIFSSEIQTIVISGINQIWRDGLDVDAVTGELAAALRTFYRIKKEVID